MNAKEIVNETSPSHGSFNITIWFYNHEWQRRKILERFNPLKTKRRLLYLKTQSVPRC